jgi:hypothetical protein
MKHSYDFGMFSGNKLLLVEDRYDNIDYEQCLTNKLCVLKPVYYDVYADFSDR